MTTACCPRCRIPLNAVQTLIAIRAGSCIDCARTGQTVVTRTPKKPPKKKRPAKRPANKKSPALNLSGILTKRSSQIRRLPFQPPAAQPASTISPDLLAHGTYVNEGLAIRRVGNEGTPERPVDDDLDHGS